MIRALWFFALAVLVAIGAAFLADVPGGLTLTVGRTEISMSVLVAAVLIALFAAVLLIASGLIRTVLDAPSALMRWRGRRRARAGQLALARGLVAVAAGDPREAISFAGRARALLPDSPLTRLLEAQAAQLSGAEVDAERHYKAMAAEPETAFLALRGLFMQALRRGDRGAALAQAKRAYALRPKTAWVVNALFDLQAQDKNWPGAADALAAQLKAKVIDEGLARRRRAVLLTAEAVDLDRAEDRAGARDKALAALAIAPGLAPAAVIAARALIADGRSWKAADTIEAAWAQAPHPDLAALYAGLKPGETPEQRVKRMRGLAALNPDHPESRLLEAGERLAGGDPAAARAAITPLLAPAPTARVCALMAEIEQAAGGEPQRVREWLGRSVRAPRDAYWFCGACGQPSPAWTPVCGHCQAFDTLAWKAPAEPLVQMLGPGGPEEAVQRLLYLPPGAPTGPAAPLAPAGPPAPVTPPVSGPGSEPAAVPAPVARPEAGAGPAARPEAPVFIAPPRPPDDPGPDAGDDFDAVPGRRPGPADAYSDDARPVRPAQGGPRW